MDLYQTKMDINFVSRILVFLELLSVFKGNGEVIKIGGLFTGGSDISVEERAFRFAINETSMGNTFWFDLQPEIMYIDNLEDSFECAQKACELLNKGVVAVFAPQSSAGAVAVESVCSSFSVPIIECRWDYQRRHNYASFNLYPQHNLLGQALKDLAQYFKMTKIAILYQYDEGLVRLQELLTVCNFKQGQVIIKKMMGPDFRQLLQEIKRSGISNIIVDCDDETLPLFLNQTMQVQMLRYEFHYVFTSLNMHMIDMSLYAGDNVNISSFRLLDDDNKDVEEVIQKWKREHYQTSMSTKAALIYDGVMLIAEALRDRENMIVPQNLDCKSDETWEHGETMADSIEMATFASSPFSTLTGKLAFDVDMEGVRENITFIYNQLSGGVMAKFGTWDQAIGLNVSDGRTNHTMDLANRTLIVTTVLEKPYVMEKESSKALEGNDRYEGYCIDLLEEIAKSIKFDYKIALVPDGDYGTENVDGNWSGMVGELVKKNADLAVAPLTINYDRETAIDFSKPYMHLGISILYRVPEPQDPGIFSFLDPLSFDVWLYVLLAFVSVSMTMFVLARFSPYEWFNSHPCNPEYDRVENQFNLLNCMWFAFGGLMQQGSEINPRAFSTRVLSGFWWFFSLILISSYTANLAAFLTVERMISPIQNADDLAGQTTIRYGTRDGGSSVAFFEESTIPTYKKMWDFMSSNRDEVLMTNYSEGINRVLTQKKYAFLMESTMIEYIVAENCKNLTQIGGLLNSRGYGIGTQLGSPYRDEITKVILRLQEDGKLIAMQNKWWKKEQCEREDSTKEDANELGLKNIGGIFLVLLFGLAIGVFLAFGEFLWKSRQNAELDKKSMCAEMAAELRFALRCNSKKQDRKSLELDGYLSPPFQSAMNGQTVQMMDSLT
ncbi:glutamate receptor ionotropic, kainate 2-like [Antedon mediterranea]|uniref:glutamate receptor ionotropic, kainate 2-like n=1 Tax=Antedon mediterranea TaxID=105859 RepID=UPI003AF87838